MIQYIIFLFFFYLSTMNKLTNSKSCPRYQCQEGFGKECAKIKADQVSNTVYLNDICTKYEYCDVQNGTAWDAIPKMDWDTTAKCSDAFQFNVKRYPGEDCVQDTDCNPRPDDYRFERCQSGKCWGARKGFPCKGHQDCFKGLYCDNELMTCQKQKDNDTKCKSSYECVNSLFCQDDKCIAEPYSVSLGKELTNDKDDVINEHKCSLKTLDGNQCSSLNQTDTEPIKCQLGDSCNYTKNGRYNITQECSCGFNTEGVGYCPASHESSKL
jgi:hypothetical protein